MFISFLRTIILYFVIIVVLRLMGKRQVGELEPSELVVAILISDLAAVPMQDIGIPMLSGIIPIVTLLALELIISEVSMRSLRFRALISGKPVFIIREGTIDQKAMEDNRLTIDELFCCLRQNGILDVKEVKYAILETSGQLTTFLYPEYAPVTEKKVKSLEFPTTVISDGRIMEDNLKAAGFDLSWLEKQTKALGAAVSDIFLMTVSDGGKVYTVKREDRL